MKCKMCEFIATQKQPGRELGRHVKKEHNLTIEEYVVKAIYSGKRPVCKACGKETRRVGFEFKEYCKEHASIASRRGGRKGGKAPAWNKGKTKATDKRLRAMSEKFKGEGNPFYNKTHSQSSIKKMRTAKRLSLHAFYERIDCRSDDFKCLTSYDEYLTRQRQYLDFKCLMCQRVSKKTLQAFERGSRCTHCYPLSTSAAEANIATFIGSLGFDIVRNDRTLIKPKEIDIVVPQEKLAIEYDGLYWHSEAGPTDRNRNYSRNKTIQAQAEGLQLFRVYEDQWRDKKDIVESMIRNKLHVVTNKRHARKCNVRRMEHGQAKSFLDKWHIYGYTPAKYALGLFEEDECLSIMTLRVPRAKKWRDENLIEIARFASKLNTVVRGGMSKLLKHAKEHAKVKGFSGILTYADLDNGTGDGYKKSGFELLGTTGPSYWYTDGTLRYSRFTYRSRNGKPEREVAREAGVYRIYGAGSKIYRLSF